MIPEGRIVVSDDVIQLPRNKSGSLLESFEVGGIELLNSSQGLLVRNWQAMTDGRHIFVKAEDSDKWLEVLKDNNITEIDLTFDQQMRIHLCYVSEGISKFYMYDSLGSKQTIKEYPNIRNPRISLDDKRTDIGSGNSDIIFAYIDKNTNELCYRVQRERYEQEHKSGYICGESDVLWKIGMSQNNAFMFYFIKGGLGDDN